MCTLPAEKPTFRSFEWTQPRGNRRFLADSGTIRLPAVTLGTRGRTPSFFQPNRVRTQELFFASVSIQVFRSFSYAFLVVHRKPARLSLRSAIRKKAARGGFSFNLNYSVHPCYRK